MLKNTTAKVPQREASQNKAFTNLTPKSVFNLFIERWWIGLIAGAVGATIFILAQPKQDVVYRTEVKLLFEPRKERVLNIQEVVDTTTSSVVELNQHIEQMLSTTFYEYVASSFTPKEIERIQNAYRDPEKPNTPPPSLQSIIRPNVYPSNKRNTTIISISVRNRDPEAAALIANRFARKYIDFTIDRAMTGTNSAIVFLKNQSEEKRIEVESAERAMQEYRAKHNMASLGEHQSVIQQKVSSIGSSLVDVQLEQSTLQTLIKAIEDFRQNDKNLLELSTIASFGSVTGFYNELQALKAQRRQLQERYLDEHPRMKENALAIEDIQRRLDENINLAIADLRTRYDVALQREKQLRKDLAEAEALAREYDKITIDYKFLEQDAATRRSAYNLINDRLNEASIVSQLENVNIKILDRAPVPSLPESGTPRQVAVGALMLGSLLLFGIPLGLGLADTRVKSPNDVEDGLDQTLLGGIKAMKKLSETERPNVFRLGKDDSLSEAYRGVFSEVEIRSLVSFPKRLLVTSSVPSEGKSLTASNLAAVFAAHGRKTLLVDCDFRRPTLRRYFGAPAGVGLLPWLRQHGQNPHAEVNPQQMGVMSIGAGFDLLPAGDAIKNPTEVIDQIAACDLFNKLSKHYDFVVLDTPPAAIFPDALLLSRFCSEMIYVCRFKTVRKAVIRKVLGKFNESGITILGIVLNCVPSSSLLNYGYDGYGAYDTDYYKSYQSEKAAS